MSMASNVYPGSTILFNTPNCLKQKAFAYIEICFECEQTQSSSNKISIDDPCNEKFDMIRKLFKNAVLYMAQAKGINPFIFMTVKNASNKLYYIRYIRTFANTDVSGDLNRHFQI